MEWLALSDEFYAALAGGVIAGLFTLLGVVVQANVTRKHQDEQSAAIVRDWLSALHDEAKTLWNSYMEGIGAQIEALADGQPFLWFYPVTQEYFTVYASNATLIGRVTNPSLRQRIVKAYALARSIIDAYRLNNVYVEKFEQFSWMDIQQPGAGWKQRATSQAQVMAEYATVLKRHHYELKAEVQALLQDLRQQTDVKQ